jgi:hypothetical protein
MIVSSTWSGELFHWSKVVGYFKYGNEPLGNLPVEQLSGSQGLCLME